MTATSNSVDETALKYPRHRISRGSVLDKKALSESDICDRFITPAIEKSGWTNDQWRREYGFTDGKVVVRGKMVARGKARRAWDAPESGANRF